MYDFWKCEFLPPSLAKCGAFAFGASEMTPAEALAVIDKMVQSIDRMRNMDDGLKSSLIADFDRLSEFAAQKEVAHAE
jgi:hypothetical protein